MSIGSLQQVKGKMFGVKVFWLQYHHRNDIGVPESPQDHVLRLLIETRLNNALEAGNPKIPHDPPCYRGSVSPSFIPGMSATMTDSGMFFQRIFTETAESLKPSLPFSLIITFRKSASSGWIYSHDLKFHNIGSTAT